MRREAEGTWHRDRARNAGYGMHRAAIPPVTSSKPFVTNNLDFTFMLRRVP